MRRRETAERGHDAFDETAEAKHREKVKTTPGQRAIQAAQRAQKVRNVQNELEEARRSGDVKRARELHELLQLQRLPNKYPKRWFLRVCAS